MPERDRRHTEADDRKRNREEHPQRPEPETLEGPAAHEDEEDSRDDVTRRGER